ncbi:MAG: branched-chain amino acid ABC transporter permease [Alphaproteobacteria bacterium]
MTSLAKYALAAAVLIVISFSLGNYQEDIFRKLLLVVALAIGFNFLFGIAGQVAFSHYAFYGIGAYAVVILTFKAGVPLGIAIIAAVAICALLALIVAIPATRLEGFYLGMATLAFAQLFIVVLDEGGTWTNGAGGITNYKLPTIFGYSITGPHYTVVIILMLLGTLAILTRLDRSWFGRACRAIRDNPEAAAAMGVNVPRTKIIVFVLTSTLAGAAGIVYAFVDNAISPPTFDLNKIFVLLFMVIVGGSGRHAGAIIGAVILFIAPYLLEGVPAISHIHPLFFGIIMVVAILYQPKGLIGVYDAARARWLKREKAQSQPQPHTKPGSAP